MLFRVQCVDRATGAEVARIYRADTPDQAAQMAMREGFMVGQVHPEAGAAPAAPGAGRLAAYSARAGRPAGLAAFFGFQYMVFPGVIRIGFGVATALAILWSIALPIVWIVADEKQSGVQAFAVLMSLGLTWAGLAAFRLIAETWIVLFSIHEELVSVRRRLEREG